MSVKYKIIAILKMNMHRTENNIKFKIWLNENSSTQVLVSIFALGTFTRYPVYTKILQVKNLLVNLN